MMYEAILLACMVITVGIMWIGIKLRGFIGGITGFFVGAVLAGFVFASSGADIPDGCSRYSSIADDC
jgi:uncharacterized transporter YbjL